MCCHRREDSYGGQGRECAVPTICVLAEMVGTRSLSSGRALARTRWLCPPYDVGASSKNIQRRVLQQHDGLGVRDAAVGDHRECFVDGKLEHLDVLAFM
jgi:hypothetical protein